jgi:hypothetical protein
MRHPPFVSPEDADLHALFAAIAARDRSTAAHLLAMSPALAVRPALVGATRKEAPPYFFAEIAHYAYAGDTALHLAAAAYEPELASDLIAHGADVAARNRRGAQPLHYATDGVPGAAHWNPDSQAAVVTLLIRAGADPNAADASGVAPLHRAVRTRCAGAVRALLASGADARRKNQSGSTPLHLAVQTTGRGGSGDPLARAQQVEIIELLLRHGGRPSDENANGRSVEACAPDWARRLLAHPRPA